ncbi:MAG: DMT family transporter [Firmicutes bacterium]|nr:DMT family transporter [Bacillota bacterium]
MNTITKQRSDFYYIMLIVIQGLIFGIGNPLVKFAYESITPIWMLAIRFTLATLIFLVLVGKTALPELKKTKVKVWLPTSLCMALAYLTCNVGLSLTTATSVGFLMSLAVVFTPPLARIVLGRKIHRSFLPVLAVAVAGLYLLSMNGGQFHFGLGEFLALLCSFGMAGSLVWGEECLATLSASAVSLIQMAVTAAACLLCAVLLEPLPDFAAVEPVAWWIILYLVILCSCVCYALQNIALTYLPAAIVSLTQCFEPIFTALFAFLFLHETLSLVGFCGAMLLLFCIVYGNYTETKINTKEMPS